MTSLNQWWLITNDLLETFSLKKALFIVTNAIVWVICIFSPLLKWVRERYNLDNPTAGETDNLGI